MAFFTRRGRRSDEYTYALLAFTETIEHRLFFICISVLRSHLETKHKHKLYVEKKLRPPLLVLLVLPAFLNRSSDCVHFGVGIFLLR